MNAVNQMIEDMHSEHQDISPHHKWVWYIENEKLYIEYSISTGTDCDWELKNKSYGMKVDIMEQKFRSKKGFYYDVMRDFAKRLRWQYKNSDMKGNIPPTGIDYSKSYYK